MQRLKSKPTEARLAALRAALGQGALPERTDRLFVADWHDRWLDTWRIAAIVAIATFVNLLVAGSAGVLIPLLLQRLRLDPALGAGVLLTTCTDIIGFAALLGVAAIRRRTRVGSVTELTDRSQLGRNQQRARPARPLYSPRRSGCSPLTSQDARIGCSRVGRGGSATRESSLLDTLSTQAAAYRLPFSVAPAA